MYRNDVMRMRFTKQLKQIFVYKQHRSPNDRRKPPAKQVFHSVFLLHTWFALCGLCSQSFPRARVCTVKNRVSLFGVSFALSRLTFDQRFSSALKQFFFCSLFFKWFVCGFFRCDTAGIVFEGEMLKAYISYELVQPCFSCGWRIIYFSSFL